MPKKGYKQTEEHKRKIGLANKKYKTYEEAEKFARKSDREYQRKKRAMGLVDKTEEYRIWRKKNPGGANAHQKLYLAIKNGKIKRSACLVCGRKDTHGHHQDYKKPYDVIWLCPVHHKLIHLEKHKNYEQIK